MRLLIALLVALFFGLQFRLLLGEGSLAEVSVLKHSIAEQQVELAALSERNEALQAEVTDLKGGLQAVEERARSELGMIREGEVFYQVLEPESARDD